MRIGVGVIGIGFWGRNHARIFSELPEAELRAVCDINLEKARAAAKRFGVEAYKRSGDLLRRGDIDAVSICTWSTNLASEAAKALRAGKHVLVEKPMASTLRQARRIVEMAEERSLQLMVGFVERFNPGVRRVKELIANGEVGVVVSALSRRVRQWPERIGDVGVIKDTAIHEFDLMRYFFDEDPVAVYAKAGKLRHRKFEDYAQIMLTFKGGKTAFIEANWLTPYKVRSLVITGSEASISLNYLTQEITIEREDQTIKPRHRWEEPLKLELQHFVRCVGEGRRPLVTGVDGLKALYIAEAALQSARSGRVVQLGWSRIMG